MGPADPRFGLPAPLRGCAAVRSRRTSPSPRSALPARSTGKSQGGRFCISRGPCTTRRTKPRRRPQAVKEGPPEVEREASDLYGDGVAVGRSTAALRSVTDPSTQCVEIWRIEQARAPTGPRTRPGAPPCSSAEAPTPAGYRGKGAPWGRSARSSTDEPTGEAPSPREPEGSRAAAPPQGRTSVGNLGPPQPGAARYGT